MINRILNNRWAVAGLTAVAWIAVVISFAMGELDRRGAYDLDTVVYNVLGWGVFGALVLGFVVREIWFKDCSDGYWYDDNSPLHNIREVSMTEEERYARGYWSVYDSRRLWETSARLHGRDD